MKKLIILLLVFITESSFGQDPIIFSSSEINEVTNRFYSPYASEGFKIKAIITIRGKDPVKDIIYVYTINFYEDKSAKKEDVAGFNGSAGFVTVFYPFSDYHFYQNLLSNYSQKNLTVTYEKNQSSSVKHLLITIDN